TRSLPLPVLYLCIVNLLFLLGSFKVKQHPKCNNLLTTLRVNSSARSPGRARINLGNPQRCRMAAVTQICYFTAVARLLSVRDEAADYYRSIPLLHNKR